VCAQNGRRHRRHVATFAARDLVALNDTLDLGALQKLAKPYFWRKLFYCQKQPADHLTDAIRVIFCRIWAA
jgi:hypothetical protein